MLPRLIAPSLLLIMVFVVAPAPCAAADQLTADFIAQDSFTHGIALFSTTFQDRSTLAASWLWDFGDGQSSTLSSPEHTYVNPGTYTVSLTIHDLSGALSNTKTIPDYIVVAPEPMGPYSGTIAPTSMVYTTIPLTTVTTVATAIPTTTVPTTTPVPTTTSARSGIIAVTSSPAGALVLLDGSEQGMTPITLYTIPVGKHVVTVHTKGYTDNTTDIQVEDQKLVKLDIALVPVGAKGTPTVTATTIEPTTAIQKAAAFVAAQTTAPVTRTGSIHVYCDGCLGLSDGPRKISSIQYDVYMANSSIAAYHRVFLSTEVVISGLQPGPYEVTVIPETYVHQTQVTTVQPDKESMVTFMAPTFAKVSGFEAVLGILAIAGIAGIRRFRH